MVFPIPQVPPKDISVDQLKERAQLIGEPLVEKGKETFTALKESVSTGAEQARLAIREQAEAIRVSSERQEIQALARTEADNLVRRENNEASVKPSGTIDFIIGMPPSNHFQQTNDAIKNSMPIVRIEPGQLEFLRGLSLVQRRSAWDQYIKILQNHGYSLNQGTNSYLEMAYIADNFPTDSFANSYGENFLQGLTEVAGDVGSSLAQMFGVRSAGEAGKKLGGFIDQMGKGGDGMLDKALQSVASTGQGILNLAQRAGNWLDTAIGGGAGTVGAMMLGSRLDFPMLWKNSSFEPSYSMTIRLYNPNPGDQNSTNKYIVGPIAAIMLLGIPQLSNVNDLLYSWPFLHRIYSPGIFDLDPAYISNITIVKGGDQQQIAFTQKLAMVDVRIDFGSLYSSIIASPNKLDRTRPTLGKYIEAMQGGKAATRLSATGLNSQVSSRATIPAPGGKLYKTANIAPTRTEGNEEATDRVSEALRAKANGLINQDTSGFYEEAPF